MRKRVMFLDGKLVEAKPALRQSLTPGVLAAKGVFETMRACSGKVVFRDRHLRRMSRGLKVLNLSQPVSSRTISRHIRQLLRVNGLKDARVRLLVWRRRGRMHSAIISEKIKPVTEQQGRRGVKAMLAARRHHRETKVPVKSLDYGLFRKSYEEATAAGFDEAILLNGKGELVEGARTNVFLVQRNVLYTPPIRCGCLPGVIRQAVIRRARGLGVRCAVKPLNARRLFDADEAFVTNAIWGVMPLIRVGRRVIGTGRPGPVTLRLRDFFIRSGLTRLPILL